MADRIGTLLDRSGDGGEEVLIVSRGKVRTRFRRRDELGWNFRVESTDSENIIERNPKRKPKPAPKRESVMPSYTPKPTFARRTVKPFEPEEAPVAAVPYRPTQLGEKFTSATSAQSADAAPVIASFNFDDVIEARRHA